MEGSVLSFLKAEWKVSDTGSAHWTSSYHILKLLGQLEAIFTDKKFVRSLTTKSTFGLDLAKKTWPPWAILILFIAYINQVSGIGWEPLVLKQMCCIHLYHIFIAFIQGFIRMFISIVDLSLQKYLLCVYNIFNLVVYNLL